MTTVPAVPFLASKRFTLAGEHYEPGDVVDVSGLPAARIANMERARYGLRVAASTPTTARATRPARDLPSTPAGLPDATDDLEATLAQLGDDLDDALLEVIEPEEMTPPSRPPASGRARSPKGKQSNGRHT